MFPQLPATSGDRLYFCPTWNWGGVLGDVKMRNGSWSFISLLSKASGDGQNVFLFVKYCRNPSPGASLTYDVLFIAAIAA